MTWLTEGPRCSGGPVHPLTAQFTWPASRPAADLTGWAAGTARPVGCWSRETWL